MAVQPVFGRLLSLLNNTRVAHTNPALYDYLKGLLDSNSQSQDAFKVDLKGLEDLIKNLDTELGEITETSVLTEQDETEVFPNSRKLVAGDNVTFDTAVDGDLKINAAGTISGGTLVVREIPTGTLDGVNVTFTLANVPISGSESVYLNGLLQDTRGIDYSIAGAVITFILAPVSTDYILVTYQR